MNLKDFTALKTERRFRDDFGGYLSLETAGPLSSLRDPTSFRDQAEYLLSATVSTTFRANAAQFSGAREIAARTLVARLYVDVLGVLPQLELAISDGNRELAFSLCGKIKQVCSLTERSAS